MDGVPLKLEIPMNNIITNARGASSITIQTMVNGKASFTVVLGCTASGKRIPPWSSSSKTTAITWYSKIPIQYNCSPEQERLDGQWRDELVAIWIFCKSLEGKEPPGP